VEPSPQLAISVDEFRDANARHARATIGADKISDAPIPHSGQMRVKEDEQVAQQPFIKRLAV
jgi:hypothetical protein